MNFINTCDRKSVWHALRTLILFHLSDRTLEWDQIEGRTYPPPYVPPSKGYDERNFDAEFADAEADLTPPDDDGDFDGSEFIGFAFVNKAYIVHHNAAPAAKPMDRGSKEFAKVFPSLLVYL